MKRLFVFGNYEINPFMASGPFYLNFGQAHFLYKWCLDSFNNFFFVEISDSNANSADPDQTPRSAASDLGLHSLSMSFLWDARLKLVNTLCTG